MLLTCPQCQNTYQLDDQLYAQQGGALCAQCQIPLVPVDNDAYNQQWQQGGDQWGQPQQNQWDQGQQGQWNQGQQGQWDQQGQWQQQEQWDQQNQWQQQQGQWDQQNQWQQQQGQWDQQNQWQQQDQWNQQNQRQQQNQWQQPQAQQNWDGPMPTMAFDAPQMDQEPIVQHNDGGERTVALDVDKGDWASQLPGGAGAQTNNNGGDDWNMPDSWNKSPASSPAPSAPAQPGVVVGHPMERAASEGMTRQIDISTVQKMYGDKVNPVKEFIRSIPVRYFIIVGGVLLVAIIGFIIGAIAINSEPDRPVASADDDSANPDAPKSFDDIVRDSKALSPSFYPFEGPLAKSGSVVAVSQSIGVVYNEKRIAGLDELQGTSSAFVDKIFQSVKSDLNGNGPIIFLFDEVLPMSIVYKIMYSMAVTSRPVVFGGVMSNGISTLELTPCNWPEHGFTTFSECNSASIELSVRKQELILRRVNGDTPLAIDPDGTTHTELRDEIFGDKINIINLAPGISRLSASSGSIVRVASDGDVSFGVFLSAVLAIRGNVDTPNVKSFFMLPVPLR